MGGAGPAVRHAQAGALVADLDHPHPVLGERVHPEHVAVAHEPEDGPGAFRRERIGQPLVHLHLASPSVSRWFRAAAAGVTRAQRVARRSENSLDMRLTTMEAPLSIRPASLPEISTSPSAATMDPDSAWSVTLNVIVEVKPVP